MKVRIDGELQEFESIEDLEDAIDDALSISRDCGYDAGYDAGVDAGKDDGYDEGYDAACCDLIPEQDNSHRETDFRRDLYRAIYAGNMEEAKSIADMMAMVDIDRELIWEARK